MTPRQLLWQVELPLAMPSIVAGIRVAAVIGVGTATIAAAVGAGGLGEYIFRGLSMVDPTVILAGRGAGGDRSRSPSTARCCSPSARCAIGGRSRKPLAVAAAAGAGRARRRWRRRPRSASGSRGDRDPRRLEELHRADHPRRAARAAARARDRAEGRAPAESRRHVHLRSRAARRRHRRLRRIHRHRRHGGLQEPGRDRSRAACSSGSGSATPTPA